MTRFTLFVLFAGLGVGVLVADEKAKEPDGTYVVKSVRKGGADILGGEKDATVTFADGTMTVTIGERTYSAKVKLDAAKTPATIDIAPADGKEKGKTFPGIYAVAGGELTLAFVEEGKRPADFKADDATLMVLRKK